MLTKKEIAKMYRDWRKENGNRRPDRVIVRMRWEDEDESRVDTIALKSFKGDKDDALILFYTTLGEFHWLCKPNNGSDFIVEDILEFYKR